MLPPVIGRLASGAGGLCCVRMNTGRREEQNRGSVNLAICLGIEIVTIWNLMNFNHPFSAFSWPISDGFLMPEEQNRGFVKFATMQIRETKVPKIVKCLCVTNPLSMKGYVNQERPKRGGKNHEGAVLLQTRACVAGNDIDLREGLWNRLING